MKHSFLSAIEKPAVFINSSLNIVSFNEAFALIERYLKGLKH